MRPARSSLRFRILPSSAVGTGSLYRILPGLILTLLLSLVWTSSARAERWLCPGCPDEVVERAADSPELVCPGCGTTYEKFDLIPGVAYINSRTRDTEISWTVIPENCPLFRPEGLQALDDVGEVYVPWSMVEWYIPRMRILMLTSGREMKTDYPGRNTICPNPPPFLYELADSTDFPGQPRTEVKFEVSETMAELFIVAFSPEGREAARARFIEEVESGKQPRLPRTQPRLYKDPEVRVPEAASKANLKAEAIIEVHVHEKRGTIGLRVIQPAGEPSLDQEAMRVARQTFFGTAGEMGVAVPAWVRIHFYFEGTTARAVVEPAPQGFWRR